MHRIIIYTHLVSDMLTKKRKRIYLLSYEKSIQYDTCHDYGIRS